MHDPQLLSIPPLPLIQKLAAVEWQTLAEHSQYCCKLLFSKSDNAQTGKREVDDFIVVVYSEGYTWFRYYTRRQLNEDTPRNLVDLQLARNEICDAITLCLFGDRETDEKKRRQVKCTVNFENDKDILVLQCEEKIQAKSGTSTKFTWPLRLLSLDLLYAHHRDILKNQEDVMLIDSQAASQQQPMGGPQREKVVELLEPRSFVHRHITQVAIVLGVFFRSRSNSLLQKAKERVHPADTFDGFNQNFLVKPEVRKTLFSNTRLDFLGPMCHNELDAYLEFTGLKAVLEQEAPRTLHKVPAVAAAAASAASSIASSSVSASVSTNSSTSSSSSSLSLSLGSLGDMDNAVGGFSQTTTQVASSSGSSSTATTSVSASAASSSSRPLKRKREETKKIKRDFI